MPAIDQSITFIYSSDLEASDAFYGGILGLELILDQGACRIYGLTPTSSVGVCSHRDPEPAGTILTIVSADVEGWYRHLVERGVSVAEAPAYNERFGIYHFFASDPDGHTIEIQRFESTRPEPRLPDNHPGWFA